MISIQILLEDDTSVSLVVMTPNSSLFIKIDRDIKHCVNALRSWRN